MPPPDDYTWIQLTSDEWLKGEVISLYDETLTFDSDNLGELRLDLEDVRHLIGSGSFEVTLLGQAPINGELRIRDQQIVITAVGETYQRPLADVIAITQSTEREIDRWTGDIGFGLIGEFPHHRVVVGTVWQDDEALVFEPPEDDVVDDAPVGREHHRVLGPARPDSSRVVA